MNWLRRWRRPDQGWPKYLPGGRLRTSTVALLVAFFALFWVHETYAPEQGPADAPGQVVPPGFVPDPNYTWVPRTNVRRPRETVPTTTETTTTTTTTEPTEPAAPFGPDAETSPTGTAPATPPAGDGSPTTTTGTPVTTTALPPP